MSQTDTVTAAYSITANGTSHEGTAEVPDNFFEGDWGSQYNQDVLESIIAEKGLPFAVNEITEWEINPA